MAKAMHAGSDPGAERQTRVRSTAATPVGNFGNVNISEAGCLRSGNVLGLAQHLESLGDGIWQVDRCAVRGDQLQGVRRVTAVPL